MGGLAVNEEVSPMGVCAGTRARSVRISVAMVLTVALAWAVLGVVGEGDICKFVDVPASGPDDLYPDNYVAAVAREGVTTGTRAAGKGLPALFSPGHSISLAQVVTMVTRACL